MENIKTFCKKYWFGFLIGFIILFGIFLRTKGLLSNPSFWHDECALAWNIKFKSTLGLFGHLRFLQVAPPFFLISAKLLTKIFGFSEITFRFVPYCFGCLSVIAFYFLATKALNKNFSVLCAVFLFAINQNLINYSFEFKPYGIDAFFAIICLLFFINLNLNKLNPKKALFYGLLLAMLPWFSFVSTFFLAGGFLYLFFKNVKENWEKKLTLSLPLFLSGLIYLNVYLIASYTGTSMVKAWQSFFVPANPILFCILFVKNLYYLFVPVQYLLFLFVLLLWGSVIFIKEKSKFFTISALCFAIFLAVSFLHIYPFAERLVVFLIPIFLLLIVKPLDLISSKKLFMSAFIVVLVLTTFFPALIQASNFVKTKTIDRGECPREMMEFVSKTIKPKDIIFVTTSSDTEFAYYSSFYKIKNEVIQERIKFPTKENYTAFLNTLKPGKYWFYLPCDNHDIPLDPWIITWAKNYKILYSYKNKLSVLLYVDTTVRDKFKDLK